MTHTMTVDVFIMSHDEMANPNAAVSRKICSSLKNRCVGFWYSTWYDDAAFCSSLETLYTNSARVFSPFLKRYFEVVISG
jgi:hypothetical protein